MDRRDYDSPYSRSPDIEILPDDEVDLTLTPLSSKPEGRRKSFDRDENEESLDIKPPPPKSNPSKKDKHKHKHKEDRKREREREKERSSRHGDRERDRDTKHRDRHEKERSELYEARAAREKDKERERERQRRKDFEELEAELKRREKSQQERDRLERLERERRKLEREAEREQREREHREKMRQEQDRIAKAEREQERLDKAEREQQRYAKAEREKERMLKPSRSDAIRSDTSRSHRREESETRKKAHSTRQDVEKRRDRDRDKDRRREKRTHDRSRSRSPRDHRDSRRHKDYYSPPHDRHSYTQMHEEEPVTHHDDHEHMGPEHAEDDLLEDIYDQQGKNTSQHAEEDEPMEGASSESSSDGDSEDSDTDSDSDSGSMPSQKFASHSESERSAADHEHEDLHHAKLRSKFDDDGPASEVESLSESIPQEAPTDEEDYLDQTPPESPLELAPELPMYLPAIQGCRNVEEFHCLNRIEEGTYGVVYRARDNKTNELVALKRLKMEKEKEGFPITSLREINTLLKAQHPNIVTVREIVVGSNMDKIYIVMDYVEHDLKSLMQSMKDPFIIGEVKTLMQQLLRGVAHLHDNWIIHRDLKTSNLLLSHSGILKIGDFGLAREYGSPLKPYTSVVVTLWYRSPELLLGIKEYSTYIDMWSVGCIFAEFLTMKPLFPGKSEIDQLNRVFKELGTPNEKIWPGVSQLPVMKKCTFAEYPYNQLRKRFSAMLTDTGFDLMNRFLTYDPVKRITAKEGLQHLYFSESPMPVPPSMFPTWPAKSEQSARVHGNTPRPPSGGKAYDKLLGDDDDEVMQRGFRIGVNARGPAASTGFSLKF